MTIHSDSVRTTEVVLLAQPGVSAFHLSVPLAIFGMCFEGRTEFRVRVAVEGSGGPTSHCLMIRGDGGLELLDEADVVVIAGWPELGQAPAEALQHGLRAAHERGAYVVGLCYGTYALAYSGLLDGKRAATHWAGESDFQGRFPNVKLDVDALYVDEDRLVTSAGTGAGLDCCIYLVRKLYGSKEANRVARVMVLPPHREGGQAQYIDQPVPDNSRDAALSSLMDEVRRNLGDDHSIDSLASKVAMSRRTFTRRFAKVTGMTVGDWVQAERLRRAKELLESSALAIDVVAEKAGFQSAVSFRQSFKRAMHVSPSDWRKTFGQ
ncbi:helix-turn-helix domain-containing protein [Stenotrophomonas maltophilia]|uniref:GlxA family transcriptional regulator n=1 Tax=Stenotrophomonas TaxID=40323 RepID=UPI000B43B1ED|nr:MULTISPECIES: helix-turn-helix domain-containing protein [Stenotrophomonas]ARZ76247.1 AraC family transcriptional regulator [Stenotrophomonas sp. WZN-1]AVO32307.1 AraC family transcriptional regulator [Stenotrophomonas maltophilia]ELC7324568.1 helix-turn-helix domain-containing protein [Stenotrophomonas maltophilia]MBA0279077.1 helix-turn-helix domain-containing protein [Stenotrophomonas maltophilia]MBA0414604.1 helix-turn-helix domain-containing protein [Stenotrophomonas maltophilia]